MDTQPSFSTYILYSQSLDKFYVGSTGDLNDRMHRHNSKQSKSTKAGAPWELKYSESFGTKSEAVRREMEIKNKKSRKHIQKLIGQ